MKTTPKDNIIEVHPQDLLPELANLQVIDVRRPDEFTGELGHIEGAKLATLGPDLQNFLERADKKSKIVFVCKSGGRSGQATAFSQQLGFKSTYNMEGGMLLWNKLGLPVTKI